MRVCVVGYGTVGKAQVHLLKELGHTAFPYDPYVLENDLEKNVRLTFICTHESNLEEVIEKLIAEKVKGLYVIKSTVLIGTTEALMRKYSIHICHNPEFLRETSYLQDTMNPDRVVIGKCCDKHGELLRKLYAPLGKPIFVTSPAISETTKLVSNTYLTTLISFWNEIDELAKKTKLKTKEIADIVCADHRISRYGTARFGEPFNGKCLPKDLDHLINAFKRKNLNPLLFDAVKKVNKKNGGP